MKKSRTNFILIISIFVALCSIFAFIFFFKVIQNKNEHISKVLLTLSEKKEDKKNSDILTSKFVELEAIDKKINNYFIDPNKIDTFVDYLEKLGLNNNTELTVKNVEILAKKKNGLSLKVSITGDFINVMKVVYLLENLDYNITFNQVFLNKEIKTVEIEAEAETENNEIITLSWQADVSFEILTLPQEQNKDKEMETEKDKK